MAPDFIAFLERREDRERYVINPLGKGGERLQADGVGRIISVIGEDAGIVTDESTDRHATCHDFRRHLVTGGPER